MLKGLFKCFNELNVNQKRKLKTKMADIQKIKIIKFIN